MNYDHRFIFPIGDEEDISLQVNVTSEGVIFDVICDGEVIGTWGMMSDEWADEIMAREMQ